ncbi:MAG: transglutaminase-like domain-containing protein [Byssovorax sp.]
MKVNRSGTQALIRTGGGAALALVSFALPGGALAGAPGAVASPSSGGGAIDAARWTATTPDEMVDQVLARAEQGGEDALAALVVASALDDRASFGRAREGLARIGASSSPLADEARWLGLRLRPAAPSPSWPGSRAVSYDAPPDPTGLVRTFTILGPFQDTTGQGLMRHEGPEAPGQRWSDTSARYSWGVYDVFHRRVLPTAVTAQGVPLDLYIHPRSESCTYLASRLTVPSPSKPFLVHVAASGAVRLIWDGADVAMSDDVHPRLGLDRLSARIDTSPGDHLLAVKVCSSAVGDEGRVRLRLTDEKRAPLAWATSSSLEGLSIVAPAPAVKAPQAEPDDADDDAPPARKVSPGKGAPGKAVPIKGGPGKGPGRGAPLPGKAGSKGKGTSPADAIEATREDDEAPPAAAIVPPKGVTVLRTPLEQSLDLGASPSPARVLAAAILRTLGGAEDGRSPRAPGLLDRLTGTPGITPDTLAMAGWISPFGANRSGWLNLAESRGERENDPKTRAFAQRRLIAAHLSSHYIDWALTSMSEAPFASATDPEARLIRAMAKRKLGSAGMSRAALEEMLAVESELGDKAPLSVLSELFDASRMDSKLHLRLAKKIAALRPESRGYGYVQAFRTEGAPAMEVAAAAVLGEQTQVDDLIRIGRELSDLGRHAWAREVFFLATRCGPNRGAAFQGLATERNAIAGEEARAGRAPSESPSLAMEALARAHDLEPSDAALKAEIAFRSDEGASDAPGRKAMRDEEYLVAPSVFLARAKQNPAKKGEIVDRQLHWVRVVTFHPDKRVSQLMHYAREVVIEPRTEQDLFENIPAEGDDTELLVARVHKKDGTVVAPEEQSAGGRRPYVRWQELKTGDVVEIAVRSWTAGSVGKRGDAPFYFIDYVGSTDTHPILYNEVVVDSPEGSPLAVDVLHGKADRVIPLSKDGRTITRYVWDNPPSIADEPLAPKLSESLPVVVGSTFHGWGDFREWYRGAVKGFTQPDDQVRRLAEELTKGKKSREEKLEAIFNFVSDDIRYVNFVSGEWWLPNRPQELLARRQGDCDDKAMLLITLLKSIGIEATEVLVQTRYTAEPSLLRSDKAAIPVFDHGIAYLPGDKGKPGIWLDATSPESRLGPLPSMDSRTVALFVDDGPPKIVDTPASAPEDHGVDAAWTITLSPSGAADLKAREQHTGDAAFELRMNLKQADARAQWVEQYLASGWFPAVEMRDEVTFKPDLPKGRAELGYGAHSEGFAHREGAELAVPIAEASTLTSQLAPLVKRTLPVVLPPRLAPGHETHEITLVAPAGYVFADLPPGGDEAGGEFGKAHLEFKKGPGKDTVVVKRSVVFDLSTIPVDKYERWRAWLQRIDGLMHRMVRLVPDGKAAPAGGPAAPAKAAPAKGAPAKGGAAPKGPKAPASAPASKTR